MATLNIMCVVCNEYYQVEDTVLSTSKCGHLFHNQCLFRSLKKSLTCPQCRRPCHRHNVHRVFLNFCEPTELDYELDMLKLDAAEWRILDLPPENSSHIPPADALQSGTDEEGNKVYVARCHYKNDMLPANYVPMKRHIRVSWGFHAHTLNCENVEYLVDDGRYAWVADSDGRVPENAVIVGQTRNDDNLYTGRALFNGVTLPGKIHPEYKLLFTPWYDKEIEIPHYEVLVRLPKPDATSNTIESTEARDIQQPISAAEVPAIQQITDAERQEENED